MAEYVLKKTKLFPETICFNKSKWKWVYGECGGINLNGEDQYTLLGGGATSKTYVNTTKTKLVKIIFQSDFATQGEFIENCMNEVGLQSEVSRMDMAPIIYLHGYVEPSSEYKSIFLNKPFYFIVMDYLLSYSEDEDGWEIIIMNPHLKQQLKLQLYKFITDLVTQTGIYNTLDPYVHFYYNDSTHKIYMIDYGTCKKCIDTDEKLIKIEEMFKLLYPEDEESVSSSSKPVATSLSAISMVTKGGKSKKRNRIKRMKIINITKKHKKKEI